MYFMSDEDPMPYKSRKKDRRWCRCKPGRLHQPIVVRTRWSGLAQCGMKERTWLRSKVGPFYECFHQEECAVCGKILRWNGVPCPDRDKNMEAYYREKRNG